MKKATNDKHFQGIINMSDLRLSELPAKYRLLPTQNEIHFHCSKHGDTGNFVFTCNLNAFGCIPDTKKYCHICFAEMIATFCQEVTEITVELP